METIDARYADGLDVGVVTEALGEHCVIDTVQSINFFPRNYLHFIATDGVGTEANEILTDCSSVVGRVDS